MAEYIDKTILTENMNICLTDLCRQYGQSDLFVCGYRAALCAVEAAPAADVEEVRHGEWMPIVIQESYFDPPYCDTCKCSMCEYEIDVSETVYNYCPNCGAKMDGKGEG